MKLYHWMSIVKIIVWASILLLIRFFVDYQQDPIVAFSSIFVWVFIFVRWIGFYIFRWANTIFYPNWNKTNIIKKSHKLSLLFGFYILINIALIFQEARNKAIWILILVGFITLQIFISLPDYKKNKKKEF